MFLEGKKNILKIVRSFFLQHILGVILKLPPDIFPNQISFVGIPTFQIWGLQEPGQGPLHIRPFLSRVKVISLIIFFLFYVFVLIFRSSFFNIKFRCKFESSILFNIAFHLYLQKLYRAKFCFKWRKGDDLCFSQTVRISVSMTRL